MASIKNLLFLFAILVSSTIILAQNPYGPSSNESTAISSSSSEESSEHPPPPSSGPGPSHHHETNQTSNFKPSKHGGPQFPEDGFYPGAPRQKRQTRKVINCNYSQQGGSRCIGCHKVRTCYIMNKGTEYTCGGLFQYCRNGQCSRTKGALCTSTTSSSTSTSTTGSTSSTGSTDSTSSSSSSSTSSSSSSSTSSTSTSTSSSSTSTSTSTSTAPVT